MSLQNAPAARGGSVNFQVSPVISAVGSSSAVTVNWGAHRVRISGDEASLEKFLAEIHPPAAAPAPPSLEAKPERLGFRVVFGSPSGYVPVNILADAPGITTTRQIAELEADISARVGSTVVLLSIMPITVSPSVRAEIAAPEITAPEQPIPADDEQVEPAQ